VRVSGAGDKVLVVSVACRHRRDAVAKLCRALEGLRLCVIAANVTAAAGTVTHTVLVQPFRWSKTGLMDATVGADWAAREWPDKRLL